MSTATQVHVISVLNLSVFVHEYDVASDLQRPTIGDEHFIGYFQQAGRTPVLLAFHEPLVGPVRGRQVFLLLRTFRL